MEQVFLPLRRYADFSGRSRRREFWSWVLAIWIASFILMYLDSALGLGGSASTYSGEEGVGFRMSGGWLTIIFMLAVFVPNLAVSVRRLHDVGKSGWMLLVALLPIFGWLYLLFLYLQPGESGPNRFGPDPKGADDQSKVFA